MVKNTVERSLQERIDDRLRRIVNFLLLNASFIDNLGLLNGKMGIAIFFYHYSRYTKNKIFEDYAGELIDEIYEEINANTPVNFEDGLTGIGWGIEYLVKQGFLEADTDEILDEIDNAINKICYNCPILLDNGNDLFGYGFYYLARVNGHENDDGNLNTLKKQQQLIYLTDECERIFVQKQYLDFNIPFFSIRTLNSVLWFLIQMQRFGLFPSKADKLMHTMPGYLVSNGQEEEDIVERYLQNNLSQIVIKSTSDDVLKAQFQPLVDNLQTEAITDKDDNFYVNSLVRLNLHRILYQPDFNICALESGLFNIAFDSIDNQENWNQRFDKINSESLSITGLSGIGLSLLQNIEGSLNNPNVYKANCLEKSGHRKI